MSATPLRPHCEVVRPDWVDYNNHLNDGYYMVIFSHATDVLMDYIGLDASGRAAMRCSLFTAEAHLNYLREVKGGDEIRVETQILGHDRKRLHIFHTLYAGLDAEPAATNEQMLLHIDMTAKRTAPFRPEVLTKIESVERAQAGLKRPANAGRAIGLPAGKD
jgi:acyl-CoA thioester hydrolase